MAWDEKKYGAPASGDAITALASIEKSNRKARRKMYIGVCIGVLVSAVVALVEWNVISFSIRASDCRSYCEVRGYPGGLINTGEYEAMGQERCICLSESNKAMLVRPLRAEESK